MNFFYGSQYGFRTNHSTEHAALELADRILYSLDHNETPLSIFLDLSKAFDTLDHNILNKLKQRAVANGPVGPAIAGPIIEPANFILFF